MITVMTGQVVDFFDQDFRELYAISEKVDLYKEFHVSRPSSDLTTTTRPRAESKRPLLPATTSRFQVSLGDSPKADIQVPAYKYYNPKYALAFGDIPHRPGSLQVRGPDRVSTLARTPEELDPERPRLSSSDRMDRLNPLPSEAPSEISQELNGVKQEKKGWLNFKRKFSRGKSSSKLSVNSLTNSESDNHEAVGKSPSKLSRNLSKLGRRTDSEQTVNTAKDNESKSDMK